MRLKCLTYATPSALLLSPACQIPAQLSPQVASPGHHWLPTVGARVTASAEMNGNEAANAIDGTGEKRWRAPQDAKSAWLEVELKKSATITAFGLDEPDVWPRLNQNLFTQP